VPETMTLSTPDSVNPDLKFGRSVSLMQAAALLNVSRRTIYNRIRDRQLATIRVHGLQRVLTSSLFGNEDVPLAARTADAGHNAQN